MNLNKQEKVMSRKEKAIGAQTFSDSDWSGSKNRTKLTSGGLPCIE